MSSEIDSSIDVSAFRIKYAELCFIFLTLLTELCKLGNAVCNRVLATPRSGSRSRGNMKYPSVKGTAVMASSKVL